LFSDQVCDERTMKSITKKLSAGVFQVVGTDYAVMNDSCKQWWVVKVVDRVVSLENDHRYFLQGSRSEAIQYAKELQVAE
jgi:hypothetical protein